uniref:Uncharacterized protein n=1 Tax=Helianthus annuus TaxID=4232 RepID=A0A251SZP5_HELAN
MQSILQPSIVLPYTELLLCLIFLSLETGVPDSNEQEEVVSSVQGNKTNCF